MCASVLCVSALMLRGRRLFLKVKLHSDGLMVVPVGGGLQGNDGGFPNYWPVLFPLQEMNRSHVMSSKVMETRRRVNEQVASLSPPLQEHQCHSPPPNRGSPSLALWPLPAAHVCLPVHDTRNSLASTDSYTTWDARLSPLFSLNEVQSGDGLTQ